MRIIRMQPTALARSSAPRLMRNRYRTTGAALLSVHTGNERGESLRDSRRG